MVLIIGLGGGTWKIFMPLFEEGRMECFRYLVTQGASGILKSAIPLISEVSWSSFLTGANLGFLNRAYGGIMASEVLRKKTIAKISTFAGNDPKPTKRRMLAYVLSKTLYLLHGVMGTSTELSPIYRECDFAIYKRVYLAKRG